MLFYEQMAFVLLNKMDKSCLLELFDRHPEIFPQEEENKSGSRKLYFDKITEHLLNTGEARWEEFSPLANYIVSEHASHTKTALDEYLISEKAAARAWVESLPVETLKEELIEMKYQHDNHNLIRQRDNVLRFRSLLKN